MSEKASVRYAGRLIEVNWRPPAWPQDSQHHYIATSKGLPIDFWASLPTRPRRGCQSLSVVAGVDRNTVPTVNISPLPCGLLQRSRLKRRDLADAVVSVASASSLPVVLSPEEVGSAARQQATDQTSSTAALSRDLCHRLRSIGGHVSAQTSHDIDSDRMVIRVVEQGKGKKDSMSFSRPNLLRLREWGARGKEGDGWLPPGPGGFTAIAGPHRVRASFNRSLPGKRHARHHQECLVFHTCGTAFATHLWSKRRTDIRIQVLIGHKSSTRLRFTKSVAIRRSER